MKNALILFLKYPEPGKVKTRIAKDIGNKSACAIYRQMAEGIIRNIVIKNQKFYDVHIFFTPKNKEDKIRDWLNIDVFYRRQEGKTLGERMFNSLKQLFQLEDYKRGIIVGTDCPMIDVPLIENAFRILEKKEIVIGPSRDGGYYLLGMSKPDSKYFQWMSMYDLFMDITWSTDKVFDQTMEKIRKNNLSCHILQTLFDIDTKEDLFMYFRRVNN